MRTPLLFLSLISAAVTSSDYYIILIFSGTNSLVCFFFRIVLAFPHYGPFPVWFILSSCKLIFDIFLFLVTITQSPRNPHSGGLKLILQSDRDQWCQRERRVKPVSISSRRGVAPRVTHTLPASFSATCFFPSRVHRHGRSCPLPWRAWWPCGLPPRRCGALSAPPVGAGRPAAPAATPGCCSALLRACSWLPRWSPCRQHLGTVLPSPASRRTRVPVTSIQHVCASGRTTLPVLTFASSRSPS